MLLFFKKQLIPNNNKIQEKLLFGYFCFILTFCFYFTTLEATIFVFGSFLSFFFLIKIIPACFNWLIQRNSGIYLILNIFILWLILLVAFEKYILIFFYLIIFLSWVYQNTKFKKNMPNENVNFITRFLKDQMTIENHFKYDFPLIYQIKLATFLMFMFLFNVANFIDLSLVSEENLVRLMLVGFNFVFLFLMNNVLVFFITQIIIFFCNPVTEQLVIQTCANCARLLAVGTVGLSGYHLNATTLPTPITLPGLTTYQNKYLGYNYSHHTQFTAAQKYGGFTSKLPILNKDLSVNAAATQLATEAYVKSKLPLVLRI